MNAPTVTGQIDDQSVLADDGTVEVANLSEVFEGENLTFRASSSDGTVVSASVDGGTLTITPQDGGEATVSATATNDAGSTDTSFGVTVDLPNAPGPPQD